jgi:general secretion pathway protein M
MTLTERFAKMEPRERTLLSGLGAAMAAIMFFFVPLYLHQVVSGRRDENQEIHDYIEKVRESRDKLEKKKAAQAQLLARYAKTMPPLASFVEEAAKAQNVEIEESQGKPDVPHGKKYTEHVILVKLRKVGLLGLVKMLEKMEKSNLPVAITRLNIKPRAGEPDSYDVELNVSAFERKGDAPKKAQPQEEAPEPDEEP